MVVAITAFSVSLQWDEPQPTNGFITSYIIRYFQISAPTTAFSDSAQMTSFMVVDLIPFTDYVFSVSAVTVEEGPSVQVNTMTAESSMFVSLGNYFSLGGIVNKCMHTHTRTH